MGPVVADLWRDEKYGGEATVGPLPQSVKNVVTNVLHRYGHMTGKELIDATHAQDPWQRTRHNEVISHTLMIDCFSRETPEMTLMKKALAQVRDDSPFEQDKQGALEALLRQHTRS